jgi:hypothetical protein
MSKPIFFQCLVLDNNDPLMLGRIRGTLITDNYTDIIRSFDDPPWDEAKNAWTERDPFIFNPLLPYFIYQVPKVKELVQIMYVNRDFKYQNQFYVQNNFYSPTSSYFTFQEGATKSTGTGMQITNPKPLKNTLGTTGENTGGIYTENGLHQGVFPEPGDNAILGRGSADLVIKENEVLLRTGKFQGEQLQPNIVPVANQQRGFLQLSRFQSVKIPLEPKTYLELKEKVLIVRYLVEWSIDNPENTHDLFTGAVYLYQLKPDKSTNTQNVTVSSVIDENLKTLVTFQEFFGLSKTDTINYINNFIKSCNTDFVTKQGNQLFPSTLTDRYPIFYRPNNKTYYYISPSNLTQTTEFNNVSNIYSQVKLTAALKQSGYGLIYKKDTVGTPMDAKTIIVPQSKYYGTPQTYSALGGDKLFLLSHQSAIPGKKKINFDNTLYGISNDKFSDDIMPNTSSTVRGEELLELINLITRFLLTHTHAYPGLPPVPVTQDGTSSTEILTELQNAVTKILNEYIRIN